MDELQKIHGTVAWEVRDARTGEVKRSGSTSNLVTQNGDRIIGERSSGMTGALAAPVGMKLGTGSTAVAKTGAGAYLTTYLTGSNLVWDGTYPQSTPNGSSRRIIYKCTWVAGVATTATAITEVVIFNDANANATSLEAATMCRALISPGAKAASDIVSVTWNHDFLGS